MIETYRGVVRRTEQDHMDHMNVQFYTAKFDEATWHLLSMVGLTNSYFKAEDRGMVALSQHTEYKAEAIAGDLLVCRSKILEVRDKTIRFTHHMFNAEQDKLLSTTEITGVHLDRSLRKTCPLPDDVREKCQQFLG